MLMHFFYVRYASRVAPILALAVSARAQEPRRLLQADSIPLELVTALVASGGLGGDPQILVGALPGWVENRIVVPANMRVLGSAFIGTSVVAVLRSSDSPEAAVATLNNELPKRGWKTPPPTPSYGGGFRPAPVNAVPNGPATRLMLCGDQQLLNVSAVRRRGVSTDVTIRLTPLANYSPCKPQEVPPSMRQSMFPTLFNPANTADMRGGTDDCARSMSSSSGTGTTLHTPMDPAALLEHYGKQIQDSGWTAPATGGSVVGRTWTRADSAGNPIELSLTVASSARVASCYELNLQVRTMRKP
jgi:hypothetical protein